MKMDMPAQRTQTHIYMKIYNFNGRVLLVDMFFLV